MNIIVDAGGQTCNRFFEYLYYLKRSILYHEKLKVLIPDITIEDYPTLKKNQYIKFPLYCSSISKVIGIKNNIKCISILKKYLINQYLQPIYSHLSLRQLHFVIGQKKCYEDEDYTMVRPVLQKLFLPTQRIIDKVESVFNKVTPGSTIVGVHIRWGDYKIWRNGQYYFSEEIYYKFMQAILRKLNKKDVYFYIATNGNVNLNVFQDINCFRIDNSSATEDLYALSKCDYIIGPLSSYSTWISLVYNIPMYCIENKEEYKTLSIEQFSVAKNFQYKENGYMFPRGESFQ